MQLNSIEELIEDIRQGKRYVLESTISTFLINP